MNQAEKTIGVGMVVFKDDQVLLIRRAKDPLKGQWSLPGGRLENGEDMEAAARRELLEETGTEVHVRGLAGIIDFEDDTHSYRLVDYWGTWTKGTPKAMDDALDARFFPINDIASLGLWDETEKMIMAAHGLYQEQRRGHSLWGHIRAFLFALVFGLGAYAVIMALHWLMRQSGMI